MKRKKVSEPPAAEPGIHACAGGCGRVLHPGQGRRETVGGREVVTCFSPLCVEKAVAA